MLRMIMYAENPGQAGWCVYRQEHLCQRSTVMVCAPSNYKIRVLEQDQRKASLN